MAIIRTVVELDCTTGLPEDRATNTYHFDVSATGEAILDNVLDLMENLYCTEGDATPLMELMSNELCAGTGRVILYNLDDPEPRAPIRSREIEGNPSETSGLPAEVSLVVSFEALPESGEPQARRRGRVYIPWFTEGANISGRPAVGIVDDLGAAFVEFGAAADASLSVDWVVWSPTANEAYGCARGWVDNAWDTQRRRGFAATTRTNWP